MNMLRMTGYALTAVATATLLLACGGSDGDSSDSGPVPLTVPKVASCGSSDTPEAALQGQVPASLRASGFKGYNCNLQLVGQYQGEGGNWSTATFTDTAGRTCAYHSTAAPTAANGTPIAGRTTPGVPVIDITDPTKPTRTTSLTTASMLDPWESLRINPRRQILIADNGQNGGGGPEIDIYDVSGDCRTPQLMSSLAVGTGLDGGIQPAQTPVGHEGNVAPDGLTYYVGDLRRGAYHAVDIANTTKPKLIATYPIANLGLKAGTTVHGMSISNDGNRVYAVILGGLAGGVAPENDLNNGFAIFDTSEVQARVPDAQIKLVSKALYRDGTVAQHTIPIKIGGKQYLIMVDEGGSGGLANTAAAQAACDVGLAPFPMARIYDISDEKNPTVLSKLMLETHDPKNCAQVIPDIAGLTTFTYGSHYCSVDNRENATALACSYFNSGVRVFDIRNPERPKEVAYYNPAPAKAVQGSNHTTRGQWRESGPDWCASRLDFDFDKKQLVTMCHDNGLLVMKFADGTWPFSESVRTTSRD